MALKIGDFEDGEFARAVKLWGVVADTAEKTRVRATVGRGHTTDSEERVKLKQERLEETATLSNGAIDPREQMIGPTGDILSVETFEIGMLARRMVVRIDQQSSGPATGFFVGKDLLLTNNHVLATQGQARRATIVCGDEDPYWPPNPIYHRFLKFDPARFFFTDKDLDLTLVAVRDPRPGSTPNRPSVSDFGYIPLIEKEGKAVHGDPLNMIHYPGGQRCSVTMHNGILLALENDSAVDAFLFHSCDTLGGSSGAPVFNARWEVVGLHSRGVPNTNKNNEILDRNGHAMSKKRAMANPGDIHWIANQATRASRITKRLRETDHGASMNPIRDELLDLWAQPDAVVEGLLATQRATCRLIEETEDLDS